MARSQYRNETIFGYISYYLSPTKRKIGIASAVIGLTASAVGVFNTLSEVSKWDQNLTNLIDAVYEGDSTSRFSKTTAKNNLQWHLVYGGIGAVLALGGAIVAGTSEKDTTSQFRKDRVLQSFADKDSIKRGDYTRDYTPKRRE